ncbi:dimethylsulfonioproprionate lyase family protein [Mesorhizobium sp. SP-1A]|uniref:dimethylsulfonioproprionate lyase family protein n=1 Tax=Mesorhizobium sp. SP-1A TaxID=3077840 RepID=UPI0028F6DB9D|nr:dimethylsulfonioproprionate lyase family protein [Mesorhizobium sp. SP-1A]
MTTIFDDLLESVRAFLLGVDDVRVAGAVSGIDWKMHRRELAPQRLDCLRHLDRAAEIAPASARPLAGLLAGHRSRLRWGQTYGREDFGQGFIDNYGWCEVFGTRGHFANDSIACGVLLLGPGLLYPDYHHEAEEIYVPLTGETEWRMGDEPFRRRMAGEVVHHASNVDHAMRTGTEPLLALYLWRGGPLAQKSVIARTGEEN